VRACQVGDQPVGLRVPAAEERGRVVGGALEPVGHLLGSAEQGVAAREVRPQGDGLLVVWPVRGVPRRAARRPGARWPPRCHRTMSPNVARAGAAHPRREGARVGDRDHEPSGGIGRSDPPLSAPDVSDRGAGRAARGMERHREDPRGEGRRGRDRRGGPDPTVRRRVVIAESGPGPAVVVTDPVVVSRAVEEVAELRGLGGLGLADTDASGASTPMRSRAPPRIAAAFTGRVRQVMGTPLGLSRSSMSIPMWTTRRASG
jgi:hypothetical protein